MSIGKFVFSSSLSSKRGVIMWLEKEIESTIEDMKGIINMLNNFVDKGETDRITLCLHNIEVQSYILNLYQKELKLLKEE